MQNNRNKTNKQTAPVRKPYLKGPWHSGFAVKRGFRILGYQILLVFVFLIIGQLLMVESALLRILLNILVVIGFGGLMYAEGSKAGLEEVSFAEIARNRQQNGKQITLPEQARCYHPAKGFYSVLIGMSPFIILAIILSFLAKEQVYRLGGLPSWVKSFERRWDIGLALAYYHENPGIGFVGVVRIIIRMLLFPYINMVGTGSKALLLLEQLSPLIILIIPSFYAIGYMRGPDLRARVHGSISAASKRRKIREKKARAQRAQKPPNMV